MGYIYKITNNINKKFISVRRFVLWKNDGKSIFLRAKVEII